MGFTFGTCSIEDDQLRRDISHQTFANSSSEHLVTIFSG